MEFQIAPTHYAPLQVLPLPRTLQVLAHVLALEEFRKTLRREVHEDLHRLQAHARKPRKVKVRRDVVLDDALTTFGKLVAPHIFRPTAVSFDGEAGVDRHGLTAEMYSLLMQDLVSPEHGLFENDHADGQLFLPCAAPREPPTCSSASMTRWCGARPVRH